MATSFTLTDGRVFQTSNLDCDSVRGLLTTYHLKVNQYWEAYACSTPVIQSGTVIGVRQANFYATYLTVDRINIDTDYSIPALFSIALAFSIFVVFAIGLKFAFQWRTLS